MFRLLFLTRVFVTPFARAYSSGIREADVIIVGGALSGSATAHFVTARKSGKRVVCLEPDPLYKRAATPLSAGGIRLQFSNEENIRMSRFGIDFVQNINDHLQVTADETVSVSYVERGTRIFSRAAACVCVCATWSNASRLLRRISLSCDSRRRCNAEGEHCLAEPSGCADDTSDAIRSVCTLAVDGHI